MGHRANQFLKLNEVIKKEDLKDVRMFLQAENIQVTEFTDLQAHPKYTHTLHHPLCVASKLDLVEIMEVLISHGFDPEEYDLFCGLNPLQTACKYGALNAARFLVHNCKVSFIPEDCSAASPLSLAVQVDNVELLTMLIAAGAPVNSSRSKDTTSVLHIAVASNSTRACQTLLANGADVEAVDEDMATPLQAAVASGNRVPVCLLLASGAIVNGNHKSRRTPLITSIEMRRLDLVKILCCSGADPDLAGADGRTPVQHAMSVGTGNYELLRYLIVERGACLESGDRCWETPLSMSIRQLDAKATRLLLEAGCHADRQAMLGNGSQIQCVTATRGGQEFLQDVKRLAFNPRSLRALCYLQVRTELGRRRAASVQTLPLPTLLKDMIALKHL